ncbi:MAG: CRISPR-associated protein Cas4 [Gudongella sp.]|nr:CRISPR-associated protein Cas4 [Gudongella sp.]
MTYDEDDYLMLSGIQHYCFCRRQWALIHMEQMWTDDARTAAGNVFHQRVDEPSREKRKDLFIARGVRVSSSELGLSGRCDLVEFRRDSEGHPVEGLKGTYQVSPVEYKVGHRKKGDWDRVQLCAQSMALEESLHTHVHNSFLFYGMERRRETVEIDDALRNKTRLLANDMHMLLQSGELPPAIKTPLCKGCSLREECAPGIKRTKEVDKYLIDMEGERSESS